jgi:hypothetical protein
MVASETRLFQTKENTSGQKLKQLTNEHIIFWPTYVPVITQSNSEGWILISKHRRKSQSIKTGYRYLWKVEKTNGEELT